MAVVMYGGVSLAIYMNGIAEELLRIVRATAAGEQGQPLYGDAQLRSSERVYRKLAQLSDHPSGAAPLRRRFIVDILAGTSAGGINAIYLAKALVRNADLGGLHDLWVEEADVEKLLNDKTSMDGVRNLAPPADPPAALFNGDRMYRKLLLALDGMDDQSKEAAPSPFVDELDLFVTATDLNGLPMEIALSGGKTVSEPRFRTLFRFRYAPGHDRDDFGRADNPFTAFTARCTSSFPVAFEPVTLEHVADVADRVPKHAPHTESFRDAFEKRWKGRFFGDYLATPNADREKELFTRPFADGGYLDNKPFESAIRAIERHDGDRAVTRKLIYIEPTPDDRRTKTPETPNFMANLGAALDLPRAETIRSDLERVLKRNRLIDRLVRITRDVYKDAQAASGSWLPKQGVDYGKAYLDDLVKERGSSYGGYHRLKVGAVTDDLALLITRELNLNDDSDDLLAVWYHVRAWRKLNYKCYKADLGPGKKTENQFLLAFDVGFRLRRLSFVIDQCQAFLRLDPPTLKVAAEFRVATSADPPSTPPASTPARDDIAAMLAEVQGIQKVLREVYGALAPLRSRLPSTDLRSALNDLGTAFGGRKHLVDVLKVGDPEEDLDLKPTERTALDTFASALEADIGRAMRAASPKARAALGLPTEPNSGVTDSAPHPLPPSNPSRDGSRARALLAHFYDEYERYDAVLFPVLQGSELGQSRRIDVFRISPNDVELGSGVSKLAGARVGHFGAFLDRIWRRNDALWGRLDGAECLIRALGGNTALVDEAHREIVREALPRDLAQDISAFLMNDLTRAVRPRERRRLLKLLLSDKELSHDERAERDRHLQSLMGEVISREMATDDHLMDSALKDTLRDRLAQRLPALALGALDPETVLSYLRRGYTVGPPSDSATLLTSAGRAAVVLSSMTDGLVRDATNKQSPITATAARFARIMLGVIRLSLPGSLTHAWYRSLLPIIALASVLLVAVGTFLSSKVFLAGVGCLAALAVLQIAVSLLKDFLTRRGITLTMVTVVGCLMLLGLAGLGARDVYAGAGDLFHRFCKVRRPGLLAFCPSSEPRPVPKSDRAPDQAAVR